MPEEVKLNEHERRIIQRFSDGINELKIGNDDKIYLSYFSKSLLDNNFISAAPTGFIFIEKFLRSELIFWRTKSRKEGEFLLLLDEIEELIEEGDRGGGKGKNYSEALRMAVEGYGIQEDIKREDIFRKLEEYIDFIDKNGPLEKNKFSFNDICKELHKEDLITKEQLKEFKSFYSKYRNVVQHGLFKRLFDYYFSKETMPVAVLNLSSTEPKMLHPKKSNLLFRQFALEGIFKDVCIEVFDVLQEVLEIANKTHS
ncbi:MAG: hypothetical protein PHY14_03155 [Candidatus Gracilibacteria bacterium]|nr:hypothetical protein [Candidatus Gracilibacteria bacterium]